MFERILKKYHQYINTPNSDKNLYNERGELFTLDSSNKEVYDKISKIYFEQKTTFNNPLEKNLYDYLFNNNLNQVNNRSFKFFIIDYYQNVKTLEAIKEYVQEILTGCIFFEIKEKLIVVYYDDYEIDEQTLTNSIYEDLFKVKVFKGVLINYQRPLDFLYILTSYFRYPLHNFYTNVFDLIIEIVQKDSRVLKHLKPIILKELANDPQIEKLIRGMFENNLNVTKTASTVYMHRNTINNKLELIKNSTSLNIQSFKDAMAMYFLINAK